MAETAAALREVSIMATVTAQLASRRREDARSFATYMRDRPEPLDGVERALLRLDWLARRLARRRPA